MVNPFVGCRKASLQDRRERLQPWIQFDGTLNLVNTKTYAEVGAIDIPVPSSTEVLVICSAMTAIVLVKLGCGINPGSS
jgi:hypothetical protein